MPFVTAPNVIEQSDFNGGWAPDPQNVAIEPNILIDMSNLLPDKGGSDALVTRLGFKRVREELAGGLSTHHVKFVTHYWGNDSHHHLIVVLTTGATGANNVRIYEVDLSDSNAVQRIDTAGTNWANPTSEHWGQAINGIYYGGSVGNGVYKFNADTNTYTANAETQTFDDWVNSTTPGAGEVAKNFAFKGNEKVNYQSESFTPARSIRYKEWENGEIYTKGERVSLKISIGGSSYWRSYRCLAKHTAVTATNRPGDGSSFSDYWKAVKLDAPKNGDGETNTHDWHFLPVAPGTTVAEWYAQRLWLRYDGQGTKSRLLYSAPLSPKKGDDVPEGVFDITDFSPTDDRKGPGGGWVEFNDGRDEGRIRCIKAYGQYLIVGKSANVYVLSGAAEPFTIRKLDSGGGAGVIGNQCMTECDGLLYLLGPDGLYVTDGTTIEPAQGNDKLQKWFSDRWKANNAQDSDEMFNKPQLITYRDRVFISYPVDAESEESVTLVYDPSRGAFYKTNLPIGAMTVVGQAENQRIMFGADQSYATTNRDLIYVYGHVDANDADDTGAGTYATQAIAWHMQTTHWPFGLAQEQRRIRRVWALVKGALTYTISMYRDWSSSAAVSETRAVVSTTPIHIEGETMADSHAISIKLAGASAPAVVYGVAVDTEPRRRRYHVNRTL